MKEIKPEDVRPQPDIDDQYIVAQAKITSDGEFTDFYQLVYESGRGWIFRDIINPKYGHSGHSLTKREACAIAVSFRTRVFSFGTRIEMDNWIMEHRQ